MSKVFLVKILAIIIAITVIALNYFKVLPINACEEKIAEEYIDKETGINIEVDEKGI